jgi:hypothetical protein
MSTVRYFQKLLQYFVSYRYQLELPFSLDEEDTNEDEYMAIRAKRFAFWSSSTAIDWFQERGYTPYTRQRSEEGILMSCTTPTLPSQDFYVEGQYPYAYHDNFSKNGNPLLVSEQMVSCRCLLFESVLSRRIGEGTVCTRFEQSPCGYQACTRQLGRASYSSVPSVSRC